MTETGSTRATATAVEHVREACRDAVASGRHLYLRVHTRSAAPEYGTRDYLRAVRKIVQTLREDGQVADVEFEIWGRHLPADAVDASDERAATLADYQAWADRNDVTLPVEEQRCNATLIEDSYTVLVPPNALVGVYDGKEVVAVAPCSRAGESTSVMDLLTALAVSGREGERLASASA